MSQIKFYHITFNSESGDKYDFGIFRGTGGPPTSEQLDEVARTYVPQEIVGNTLYGGFVVEALDFLPVVQDLPPVLPAYVPLERL